MSTATHSKPERAVPRLALSPDEAAATLGVSRDYLDEHIACELRRVRRGRRKLVAVAELERSALLRAQLQAWPAPADPEIVQAARDEVRRPIRSEVRAELLAEIEEAQLARRALSPGETTEVDEPELVDGEVVEDAKPRRLVTEDFLDPADGPEALHRASRRRSNTNAAKDRARCWSAGRRASQRRSAPNPEADRRERPTQGSSRGDRGRRRSHVAPEPVGATA